MPKTRQHYSHSCAVFERGCRIAESGSRMTPERWREIEEIYQSTMDQEPGLRDAHLADTCRGDEELRREVESLLRLNSSPVLVDQPAWQAVGELLDNDSAVA